MITQIKISQLPEVKKTDSLYLLGIQNGKTIRISADNLNHQYDITGISCLILWGFVWGYLFARIMGDKNRNKNL